jgi:tetratricopeptide (TPR) repeat protein
MNIKWEMPYDEINPLYQQVQCNLDFGVAKEALRVAEKAVEPNHHDVAQSLNNLAVLYGVKGNRARAESLFKRALAIDEEDLGPDHPEVATDLNNLAMLYYAKGQYAQAEPLFKRALAIREKALGPDHPDLTKILNPLARLYDNQGLDAKAGPLFRRVLAIEEKAFGVLGHISVVEGTGGPDNVAVAIDVVNTVLNLFVK